MAEPVELVRFPESPPFGHEVGDDMNTALVKNEEKKVHDPPQNETIEYMNTALVENAESTDNVKLPANIADKDDRRKPTLSTIWTIKQLKIICFSLLALIVILLVIFVILTAVLIRRIDDKERRIVALESSLKTLEQDKDVQDYELIKTKVHTLELDNNATIKKLNGYAGRLMLIERIGNNTKIAVEECYTKLTAMNDTLKNSNGRLATLETEINSTIQDQVIRIEVVEDITGVLKNQSSMLTGDITVLNETLQDFKQMTGLHIGFTVTNPPQKNLSSYSTLPLVFTSVHYNADLSYNTTDGKFICRYPGMYLFIATIVSEPQDVSGCSIYVKSTLSADVVTDATSGTSSLVAYLKIEDQVFLSNCSGTILETSSFSGVLLEPDLT